MGDLTKHVEKLIEMAGKAAKSDDALKFSQAAANAAHAMSTLAEVGTKQ